MNDGMNRISAWQAEGRRAADAGRKRTDCPYDKDRNYDGWNNWLYGYDRVMPRVTSTGHMKGTSVEMFHRR